MRPFDAGRSFVFSEGLDALSLCCGPDFAISCTACRKRFHASGSNSIVRGLVPGFRFFDSIRPIMTQKLLREDQKIKPRISDEQCELIGELIINWSRLESALEALISYFLKLAQEDGRIVTATLDARPKVRMIRALAALHIRSITIKKKLPGVLANIEKRQEDRNFIAHGQWGTIMPDSLPTALSLRPEAQHGRVVGQKFPKPRMLA